MKAVQVTGYGDVDKLECVERKAPQPKRDEVLIKVKACGINNTEIWMREGAYGSGGQSGWRPEGVQFPRIPGSDITGCIEKIGDEVDESLIEKMSSFFHSHQAAGKDLSISQRICLLSDRNTMEDMQSMSFGRLTYVMRCLYPIRSKVLRFL
ncbi:alcohol dehydrogenase catalytic domain-containing protein [Salibacterium aidingense]|uniref:alcohol dehydrogenase catalytic domain-containing protein n=1 Tax=Salibacterium aidingense TaxID=384933 RepID=UPI00040217E2